MEQDARRLFGKTVEGFSPAEREAMEERYAIVRHCGEKMEEEDVFILAVECVLLGKKDPEPLQKRNIISSGREKNHEGKNEKKRYSK